ncbi:MAG: maltoporin [Psychromonas sp.]|jgi:maltoporin|uniref:carbohydrate porin n=1 Tax=Psychromonas sp. TaxID=1884585 RepID=UPI0039E36F0C
MKLSKITLACALAAGMAAPQIASADDAFEFHGYARWGTQYEQDGNKQIAADGQTGNAAGRLGNEGNGGEWLFVKRFEPENATKWDLGLMIDDWGNGLGVKQAYAGASNIWASQSDAYVWAGRVFHSRMQQGLTDYYLSIQDGQGAGIKGLNLGFATLELGFVDANDGANFAVTSKLSNIKLGDELNLDIIANYGFTDDTVVDPIDAYLLVAKLSGWGQNAYYRHSDNTENSLSWGRVEGLSSDYLSVDGSFNLAERTNLEYLASYHMIDEAADSGDRDTMNIVLRPTHAWNEIHSTWLEAGYSFVDYDNGDESSAAKLTLSQNIAVGGVTWARPMLRFYVTAGQEENRAGETENPVIAGAMFEAWW